MQSAQLSSTRRLARAAAVCLVILQLAVSSCQAFVSPHRHRHPRGCRGVSNEPLILPGNHLFQNTGQPLTQLAAKKKKESTKSAGTTKKKKASTKKKKAATKKKAASKKAAAKAPVAVTESETVSEADAFAAAAASVAAEITIETDTSQFPYDYAPAREFDEALLGDLTGGRPGAIIETAEQLELKQQTLAELEERGYDAQTLQDYGELAEEMDSEYDTDDPDAIDAATLGTWTIYDLQTKFDYEWDPSAGDQDPNQVAMAKDKTMAETPKDEDGIEIGFTSYFGPSNPIDTRTILGTRDSYVVDETTRDDSQLTPQFASDDLEKGFNEDFVKFRKSLDIMETYIDPFLPSDMAVPRHVAKWHGYPEQTHFRPQNYTNNRFTDPDKKTDFDILSPFRARQLAVEMARAQNAEWMPAEVHHEHHSRVRMPYEKHQTLAGTLRKGDIDPDIVAQMEPAIKIMGSSVELLSTWQDEETGGIVARFAYHGLMKNRWGMKCWFESLLREEAGMDNVNNIVFETGFRRRDPADEGGDYYYGPSSA